ncbi:hypothetical protein [Spongiimicrobium salis]|uniref:hypothetical protein n=1 Tax=Spongiimicrobium salis TaxID=1667022 RepID=UPI00374DB112
MGSKHKHIVIEIKDREIRFPKGYFFSCSPIHLIRHIAAEDIAEINLSIHPPALIYQKKEFIFISSELKTALEHFAKRNRIPLVDRFDIWEHLNHTFLDTEFDQEEKQNTQKLLSENGISTLELRRIRKRIGRTMWLNALVWEWTYLGLFDYLKWTFLTPKKYWWAMEIALRNYTKIPKT